MHLATITRYPLKGFAGELLEKTQVEPNCTLPCDRQYALQHPDRKPLAPNTWRPKKFFLQSTQTNFCAATKVNWQCDRVQFQYHQDNIIVSRNPLDGRPLIQWIESFDHSVKGCTLESLDTGFTDKRDAYVSMLNRSTISAIAKATNTYDHPERYRGNLLIDGLKPFEESLWVGRQLLIGEARLEVIEPIVRCKATEFDWHGTHSEGFLDLLEKTFKTDTCGIFLRVILGGSIAVTDKITLLD